MNKEEIEAVLFDLDGTLFRSTPILHEAYRRGVEQYNRLHNNSLKVPSEEDVLNQVGNPVSVIYANLFPGVKPDKLSGLGKLILDVLAAEIKACRGELIEGVETVLKRLQGNYQLAIVTNAQRLYMDSVLGAYELASFFDRMECIEDVDGEEKVIIIKNSLREFDIKPRQALMVGDRSSDLEAARLAGTHFIGCDFGHGQTSEFDGEPTISHLNQLVDLLL